jgi:hypothetical protein
MKMVCINNDSREHELTLRKIYDTTSYPYGKMISVLCDDDRVRMFTSKRFQTLEKYKNKLIKIRFGKK